MALCVCHNHPTSVPPPWLECVHALGHGFMSTLLLMLAQPPMHSLMETWMPLYAVCLCPSDPACVPTSCLEYFHAPVHEFMST